MAGGQVHGRTKVSGRNREVRGEGKGRSKQPLESQVDSAVPVFLEEGVESAGKPDNRQEQLSFATELVHRLFYEGLCFWCIIICITYWGLCKQ